MDTQYDGRLIESLVDTVERAAIGNAQMLACRIYVPKLHLGDVKSKLSNLMDSANELRVQRGQQPWEGSHA